MESYRNLVIFDQDYFGKGIAEKRNINWLDGMSFSVRKIRVDWVLMTFKSLLGKWLLKVTNRGWGLSNASKKKIHWLKSSVTVILETG